MKETSYTYFEIPGRLAVDNKNTYVLGSVYICDWIAKTPVTADFTNAYFIWEVQIQHKSPGIPKWNLKC